MRLSLNWLKDFVDIPKRIPPEELALRLTMHTVEVDSVKREADKYKDIVVGKIIEIKKHPNSDKLKVARVKVRTGELEIVCGALNIKAGQMVPVALAGAILPNGAEIKEAEIRGVKSAGMLCSEDEMGMGEDHSGIMILQNTAKLGQNFADYLKLDDVVLEVDNKSITHRPDLWSHCGMAREISAFLGARMTDEKAESLHRLSAASSCQGPSASSPPLAKEKATEDQGEVPIKIDVKVEDFKLCPRYMAVAMDGISIQPSPKWMRDRLVAVGVRPISNIVDITNYVLLELGQPLHAFDKNLIADAGEVKIIVRRAHSSEIIETLDGQERQLDENNLVIADKDKPIAIAGVMGGAKSEIGPSTTAVVFESANFDFVSIRKTSQKFGLRTEASIRYEKTLDPNLCEEALARVVGLVKEICPDAKVASNLADEKNFNLNQGPIELDLNWLNVFIGEKIKEKKVAEILARLGFGAEADGNNLRITAPSWRATKDISIKEDIAEEVARIFGYGNLTPAMPKVEMKAPLVLPERTLERKIKNYLSQGAKLAEVYNYSFADGKMLKKLGLDPGSHIRLANPISKEQAHLKQALAPNLLCNIRLNQARHDRIGIFEIGSVFSGGISGEEEKEAGKDDRLPYQEKRLGIALAGGEDTVFTETKSIVAELLDALGVRPSFNLAEARPYWADESEAAKIMAGKIMLGTVFRLSGRMGQSLGIKRPCAIAEISIKELGKIYGEGNSPEYVEFEKYPPALRDLAFVVSEKILYNDIKLEIASWHPHIKKVELFDVYFGEKIGIGKKNLAFNITYQAGKTLTAAEVDAIQAGLIKHLEEKFEAKIRDF